ncbi:exopolysaccharide biosynthesis polyprenyl glycosylphosphotransferase [Roseobacter sp.]|uniref:exopolysaccharide biosynthesis polyprenyl glycosylphosphotransferase n=1 Tax=Roseobacter sp. TaxID=1907202 RepID=UPI003296BF6C
MAGNFEQEPQPLGASSAVVARMLSRAPLAPLWVAIIAMCVDFPVVTLAFWFAQYASLPADMFHDFAALGRSIAAACVVLLLLAAGRAYDPKIIGALPKSLLRSALALAVPVAAGAVIFGDVTNNFIGVAIVSVCLSVFPLRYFSAQAARWMRDNGVFQRRAVIAGGGDHADRLVTQLVGRRDNDVRIYGVFDDREDGRVPLQSLGVPKLGGYEELITFVRATEVDMVIIALPLDAKERIDWLLNMLKVLPVEVRLSAINKDLAFADTRSAPLFSVAERTFAPGRRLAKRAFDLVIAILAIVVLSPVILGAAIAVKLDSPGPVLFRQKRHGFNHRVIDVMKFRSMYQEDSDFASLKVVSRGDPRVTRVGRFLRRSSIDELPQLFNVLWGDLSLVGPRPHAIDARSSDQEKFSRIVEGYSARHRLPPGITGLAQVKGWRGEVDSHDKLKARFEHDLIYIENWSLLLDLKILAMTPLSLIRTDAAY